MTEKKTDGRSNNGGARPGSGPKPSIEGGAFTPAYLDEETREGMRRLGRDNLSEGIRLAYIMINNLPDGARAALEIKARKIQEEKRDAVRASQAKKEEE